MFYNLLQPLKISAIMCLALNLIIGVPSDNNNYRYFNICYSLSGCIVYAKHRTNYVAVMTRDCEAHLNDSDCILLRRFSKI
jgi:hypothetical protein